MPLSLAKPLVPDPVRAAARLHKLKQGTRGLNLHHRLADGRRARRVYLDSAATTLQLGVVEHALAEYMPHYASTHTQAHFAARLANRVYQQAHRALLKFVNADAATHGCFFIGSGSTAGLNRVAYTLAHKRPQRDVVIASSMEHHSNDLPHRRYAHKVVHIPPAVVGGDLAAVDMPRLERALQEYGARVNYVAITGVSNVTGVVNPIYDIAALAHRHGALIVVDAAQMAAHVALQVSHAQQPQRDLDVVCLSGHKLYAPMSPGVVVTRLTLFDQVEPQELGGGMVDDVFPNHYIPSAAFPQRQEAGTPNIPGAVGLAVAVEALQSVGMDFIEQQEAALMAYALQQLGQLDSVVVYGQTAPSRVNRIGALSFNLRGMHHSLTAAILNDYFNIAVRNACFCAHPYVREMISHELAESLDLDNLSNQEMEALADLQRGMVRASFGLYNDSRDVDALVAALRKISADQPGYAKHYVQDAAGDYQHTQFDGKVTAIFSLQQQVAEWFA